MSDLKTREQKEGQHEIQHAFHSGWGASSEAALENANALRGHMAERGMDTDEKNWSVFSDPREWQVLKEKGILPGEPPTMQAAAEYMAANTMAYKPTMWHGHSQGAAQISSAGALAADTLASDPKILGKAERNLQKYGGYGLDGTVPQEIIEAKAHEKAEGRLNKYNMFSYSGGAMYPPEWADDAAFSHKRGDPVSSAAVELGAGPDWEDGDGREKIKLDANMKNPFNRKYLQANITNHFYDENYAENDAEVTERMLERTGRLDKGLVRPASSVAPLTGPGKGVGEGDNLSTGPRLGRAAMYLPRAVGSVAAEGYEMAKDTAEDGLDLVKGLGKGAGKLAKGGYGLAKAGFGKAKGLFSHYED